VRSDALDYPGNRNRVSDLLEAPGLLGGVQAVELALNEFLTMAPSGDGVMQYETRDADGVLCRVLVFTRPIRARGDFSALSRRAPFAARPLAAPRAAIAHCVVTRAGSEPALYTQNAREGFSTMTISGEQVLTSDGSDNDIFTCEYLPVTGDTAKVFQIPIDTKMVNESANNQLSSMTTYVILSVMFTVAIYFCAPALYDAGWLRAYKTRLEAPFVFLLAIKSDLTYLDMFATIVTLILSMTLIGVGVQKSKTSLSLMGIFFLLMFVVGAGSIQISRLLRGNSVGVVESVKPT
jgi:hypothetical protein